MASNSGISSLGLVNYKGFREFELKISRNAVLVGANSAGKSTLLESFRTLEAMMALAKRRNPSENRPDRGSDRLIYPMTQAALNLDEENLRHEFNESLDTRLELGLRSANGWKLHAVWPAAERPGESFFYLETDSGWQAGQTKQLRDVLPEIGVIPALSPLESHENYLKRKTIETAFGTRVSSRHFRNHLYLLQQTNQLQRFLEFCDRWAPEVPLEPPVLDTRTAEIDLFYREGRGEREIAWAGDGYQVWLQLLLYVFLLPRADVLLLDEPEVFLHPDLQRRLVRLLDDHGGQFIMATHSSELVYEASDEDVVWVDRRRTRGVVAPAGAELSMLSDALGTGLNMGLARVLRSRLCLFVEGKDMTLLRRIAATVGARSIAEERGVAVVPIEGLDNTDRLSSFDWLAKSFLQGTVTGMVILDRDYHTDHFFRAIRGQMDSSGVELYVWQRKELESYLLSVPALARISGASESVIASLLEVHVDEMRGAVEDRMRAAAFDERVERKLDMVTVSERFRPTFERMWADPAQRLHRVPPKSLLSHLNRSLQREGYSAVSFRALAHNIRLEEIDPEVSDLLRRLDSAADRR